MLPYNTLSFTAPPNPVYLLQRLWLCEVGSSSHGVSLPGADDLDIMGVGVEHPDAVLGLEGFGEFQYRTAVEREGKTQGKEPRSQPGDLDYKVYGLRKFAGLAMKGNPSVLLLLYAPMLERSDAGDELRLNRHVFSSKAVGRAFLGYLDRQRVNLIKYGGGPDCKRPELVEKYGYDTKFAMHMLRLGIQGKEFMSKRTMTFPMEGPHRDYLLAVREGAYQKEDLIDEARILEEQLEDAMDKSTLPETPDREPVNRLLKGIYTRVWQEHRDSLR